jgi:hypothetical protein
MEQLILLGSVPAGLCVGVFLGLDARAKPWSNRPIYQFAIAGACVVALLVFVELRTVTGSFDFLTADASAAEKPR